MKEKEEEILEDLKDLLEEIEEDLKEKLQKKDKQMKKRKIKNLMIKWINIGTIQKKLKKRN